MWDNQEDARMRIADCIVKFGGYPVLVENVNADLEVRYRRLPLRDRDSAHLTDPGWDWSPVSTGFLNHGDKAIWSTRLPVRKWKQGLHHTNVMFSPNVEVALELLESEAFYRTMTGQYPQFEAVMKKVMDKVLKSAAFDRHYAIDRSGLGLPYLLHRGNKVGWLEGDTLKLGDGYEYLREEVNEAIQGRNI